MISESPSPRRPPPRPPKSRYLLDREAKVLASRQAVSRVSSIPYPKGKNPFGESSEDESDSQEVNASPPQPSSQLTSSSIPIKVGTNPFADCDSDKEETKEKQPSNEVDNIGPPQNIPEVKESLLSNPATNCESDDVEEKNDMELDEDSAFEDQAPITKVSSTNPFDEFTDEEESGGSVEPISVASVKEEKEEGIGPKAAEEKIMFSRPRPKRLAPQPPSSHSSSSKDLTSNVQPGLHLSLQAVSGVAEKSASPLTEHRRLSTSYESVRVKGPAPPLPVGQRREIRAEGFVKYPRLRREIEEVNARLIQYDEEIEALKAKMDAGKFP